MNQQKFSDAIHKAVATLKKGDKVRCRKCPGRRRTFTFSHFDGPWMVSKSGINDYPPTSVDRVNGQPISFL